MVCKFFGDLKTRIYFSCDCYDWTCWVNLLLPSTIRDNFSHLFMEVQTFSSLSQLALVLWMWNECYFGWFIEGFNLVITSSPCHCLGGICCQPSHDQYETECFVICSQSTLPLFLNKQRRLRHLRSIAARNILNKNGSPLLDTYFTLHLCLGESISRGQC